MVLTAAAIVIAFTCIGVSAERLRLAAGATALDPSVLARALTGEGDALVQRWRALVAAIEVEPRAAWERGWVEAIERRPGERRVARTARVNEQLADLDYEAQRWARVPRVCARVATTSGFLIASLAMRDALENDVVDVNAAIFGAVNAVTIGLAAGIFCVAVQSRARAITRARLEGIDRMTERLDALADAVEKREPGGRGGVESPVEQQQHVADG